MRSGAGQQGRYWTSYQRTGEDNGFGGKTRKGGIGHPLFRGCHSGHGLTKEKNEIRGGACKASGKKNEGCLQVKQPLTLN